MYAEHQYKYIKKMTKTDIKKKAMIQALEKSLGIVTNACKQAGISRQTHYEWMRKDLDYAAAVNDISDIALDFAESKLHEQIFEGSVPSIIFYLKTKGKARGYVERQEFDVKKTEAPDLSGLSTDELLNIVENSES